MIKLNRLEPPKELTDKLVKQLTEEFQNSKNSVWSKNYIKRQLLLMTNNKCAYCEAPLDISGSYMEVEHFLPKNKYPEKVVEWTNLLPSCKRCNVKKGAIDPKTFEIIDPSINNPKEHLSLKRYRIVGKDIIGKHTVSLLNLNDLTKLVMNRAQIGEVLSEKLGNLEDEVHQNVEGKINTSRSMKIRNTMMSLLQEVQRSNSYSATLSSVLISDPSYSQIKSFLDENNLWDEDLQELELKAREISLEIVV